MPTSQPLATAAPDDLARVEALMAAGRLGEAEAACRALLAEDPTRARALMRLGEIGARKGAWEPAIALFVRALGRDPGLLEAYRHLGHALAQRRRFAEARRVYAALIERAPEDGEAHSNLGAMYGSLGDYEAACRALRRAVELRPGFAPAHNNLGVALARVGRHGEAIEAYRRAIVLAPDYRDARCNLVFAMDLDPDTTAEAQRAARLDWGERLIERHVALRRPHANPPDPERRLRVGYLSPDFRRHAAGTVALPLFLRHDRDAVEVHGYFNDPRADEVTERFAVAAEGFRAVAGWSDERLAQQIRADGIDILVDLAGHSLGGRLELLAIKPAPLQFSGFGYGAGSTGLRTVDGFFAGPVQAEGLRLDGAVEEVIELPAPFAIEPPEGAPPVTPLPLLARGQPTFGSFNRLSKVCGRTLDLWAAALAAVPAARFLVKAGELDSPGERERLTAALAGRGVAPGRLELRGASGRAEHLAAIAEADLLLDTTPQSGSATTAEALWMGVPTLTPLGARPGGRASASLLHCVGLEEFVVADPDGFGTRAAALLAGPGRLARLREGLRDRLRRSPIVEARPLVAALEAAYRERWRRWCAGAAA
ncbi:Predicted O-linked N-acetylglucosamine transferase, SPINDLY family [Tistlia consotensis]|uniref:protein O-GlcNAc transferase n=1 Tax=Tistlia consotensis USBA 355 TaxID=560819 RepID=A0A1Y6B936_9PROT|nr:tetratricopeptide repeat protein [Tistlia consotensis]SME99280.1 Predicted O-linked N-acetylglucosamine transferase, SPINDLY family [Tistlia consotensis USBA 355]SNR77150.1 Predicted O-linked N-acetylglucosamine transferase, SPINDLY family [Tistlia consotensis]